MFIIMKDHILLIITRIILLLDRSEGTICAAAVALSYMA